MLYFTLIRYSRDWGSYQVSCCNEATGSRFRFAILNQHFESFMVAVMTLLAVTEYLWHRLPRIYVPVVVTIPSFFPLQWLTAYYLQQE